MSEDEKKQEITGESALAPQIGSDVTEISTGMFDPRITSKLTPLDKIWIAYFLQKKDKRGGAFAKRFCVNYLKLATSEDGWRINKMIQAIAAGKGVPTAIGEIVRRPNWIRRHTTDRDWEKKAEESGATVVK